MAQKLLSLTAEFGRNKIEGIESAAQAPQMGHKISGLLWVWFTTRGVWAKGLRCLFALFYW
ncbi:hypothetical protein BN938_2179 [Mucinivorans hirudinis]|uniref:Uncharacterized protein n=1 Tax=Mucinivorans hirudinis TaxID=1433126 RepID=A0A060R9J0_9BACT|nr:hypothetical protein BN938_2179 [Mucinivorans hirudinis]